VGGLPYLKATPMTDVTRILSAIDQGDAQAAEQLLPLVYDELRRLAAQKLSHEKPGQTLQATALVHEAYIRLVDDEKARHWDSRRHFFAAATEAMRRILIESARRKKSRKHGGDWDRVELDSDIAAREVGAEDLLAVDDAVSRLAVDDPQAAELVKLRYFAGLSITQAAEVLGISRSSAYEQWTYARAWLQCALDDGN
jgi:RNA polymerase sigma factor (TIGR02999 family)